MKRTAPATSNASNRRQQRPSARSVTRRFALLAAFILCAGLMFLVGRGSVGIPGELRADLQDLQRQIRMQQGQLDRLSRSNVSNLNALAARLAELQAASTRLDALGARLAQMGDLTLDEFDFSGPAALGGPAERLLTPSSGNDALQAQIAALSEKLRRQSSQLDTLQSLMVNRQLENDLTPAGWPVRRGWISSRFGERNDPFTGERVQHRGLDFAGTRGTDVLSVASGVVIWSAPRASYGKTVEVDHGNGYRTRYAHNEELVVRPGEHVRAGQVIAKMGSTGRASAPHVHFEVLKDGARINPSRFVTQLR
jgi:murein DD-endopeptidase MepM/ murein hydrolase activator NlpD